RKEGVIERKMLDKLWDDVLAGPHPQRGLGKFRKMNTNNISVSTNNEGDVGSSNQRSLSMPSSPGAPASPTTPSPTAVRKADNVWRSVFNPGSNLASRGMGSQVFDKPQPNSPTVYDWLYSGETRSKHHH
ncbi:hypothetical protein, partial [Klebsiella pneumoniae]|uniref:hypothetical protein n=1 Tax=Klebsiella pneumoniae TaxID=573 RepID=UPI003013271B